MKKALVLLLTVIFITSLLLTSCRKDTTSDTPDVNTENGGNSNGENENGGENGDNSDVGGNENGGENGGEAVGFTEAEKAMLTALGFEIPYLDNNGYTLVDCSEGADGSALCFTAGVGTQGDFDSYRTLFSAYEYHGTKVDENGITHHSYYTDGFYIDMYYTAADGEKIVVCVKTDKDGTGKNPTENENGDCDVEFGDM